MKNTVLLIIATLVLFSCNSDDNQTVENTVETTGIPGFQKLAKIVLLPGQNAEQLWLFNNDGLLSEIRNKDGNLIQSFTYNSHQNLIQSVKGSTTFTFGYDTNNRINNCNGQPVIYNAANNSYKINFESTITDDYLESMIIYLNEDWVILGEEPNYINSEGGGYTGPLFGANYSNGNMMGYYALGSNGEGDYRYDTFTNPLKKALLPICRAFSVICFILPEDRFAIGEYNSANNVTFNGYDLEGPEDLIYEYEYNANNLPVKRTAKAYYLDALEYTYPSAEFYYQTNTP